MLFMVEALSFLLGHTSHPTYASCDLLHVVRLCVFILVQKLHCGDLMFIHLNAPHLVFVASWVEYELECGGNTQIANAIRCWSMIG
jgi:hypothetical protein